MGKIVTESAKDALKKYKYVSGTYSILDYPFTYFWNFVCDYIIPYVKIEILV